jgi:hypothetical protein
MSVCRHAGVMAVRLPHDLVDDELRVTVDVKPLNPKLGSDARVIDECLIFHHIVGRTEVQLNHVEERSPLGHISTMPPPALLRVKETSKYMLKCSWVTGGVLCLSSFDHEIHQGLGLDRRLWGVGCVKPHKVGSPLGDPPHGEAVFDNFPEPV